MRRSRSSSTKDAAAFIGPIVWLLEGPSPILKISSTLSDIEIPSATTGCRRSLFHRQQRRVAADCRRIDRERTLVCKPVQVVRAAGLRTRARKPASAERLRADHGADHIAVDIDVARTDAGGDAPDRAVDAAVDPERESVAGRIDRIDERLEIARTVRHDMEHGPEHFALEYVD